MSNVDKRKLGAALSKLSPEDLTKALEIVAQDDPSFSASSLNIDLDMDTLVSIRTKPFLCKLS